MTEIAGVGPGTRALARHRERRCRRPFRGAGGSSELEAAGRGHSVVPRHAGRRRCGRSLCVRRLALGAGHGHRQGARLPRPPERGRRIGALKEVAQWVQERRLCDARDDGGRGRRREPRVGRRAWLPARSDATRGSFSTSPLVVRSRGGLPRLEGWRSSPRPSCPDLGRGRVRGRPRGVVRTCQARRETPVCTVRRWLGRWTCKVRATGRRRRSSRSRTVRLPATRSYSISSAGYSKYRLPRHDRRAGGRSRGRGIASALKRRRSVGQDHGYEASETNDEVRMSRSAASTSTTGTTVRPGCRRVSRR